MGRGGDVDVFCCSDTHGSVPNPAEGADLILHAGDFYNRPRVKRPPEISDELDRYVNVVLEDRSWFAVRGNHDCVDPLGFFSYPHDVGGRVEVLDDGTFLVGIGWHGEVFYELPDNRAMSHMCAATLMACARKMRDGDRSILLTHYCPTGAGLPPEEGWFYEPLRDMMDALRPLAVIQGHSHPFFGMTWVDEEFGTKVICPGPEGVILRVDGGSLTLLPPCP
jgi:Icc-related predicted phosphoesterase